MSSSYEQEIQAHLERCEEAFDFALVLYEKGYFDSVASR